MSALTLIDIRQAVEKVKKACPDINKGGDYILPIHPRGFCRVYGIDYRTAKGHVPQIIEQLKAEA